MSNVAEKKQVFEFFEHLPPELRLMLIDEMEPKDRCRFTRCSKSCRKEAMTSKKFMAALHIEYDSLRTEKITIDVIYHHVYEEESGEYWDYEGFCLVYENKNGQKTLKYSNQKNKEFWTDELPSTTNVLKLAIRRFKGYLKAHQNTIKSLALDGRFSSHNLVSIIRGVKSLKNLEEFNMMGLNNNTAPKILSMIRRPLRNLATYGMELSSFLAGYEQVYKVKNYLCLSYTKFTNEQMLRLSAPEAFISIGELTVDDIYNFIKSWQTGNHGKNLKIYKWNLKDSEFDKKQLFDRFGIVHEKEWGPLKTRVVRRHDGKIANLMDTWGATAPFIIFDALYPEEV